LNIFIVTNIEKKTTEAQAAEAIEEYQSEESEENNEENEEVIENLDDLEDGEQKNCVYHCSVCPTKTLSSKEKLIAHLNGKPHQRALRKESDINNKRTEFVFFFLQSRKSSWLENCCVSQL